MPPPRISHGITTTRTGKNGKAFNGIHQLTPNPFVFDFALDDVAWLNEGFGAQLRLVDDQLQLEQLLLCTDHENPTALGTQGRHVKSGALNMWLFGPMPLQLESCVVGFQHEYEFEAVERWEFVDGKLHTVIELSQPETEAAIAPINEVESKADTVEQEVLIKKFLARLDECLAQLEQAPTDIKNLHILANFGDQIEYGWEWTTLQGERAVKVFLQSSQIEPMFEHAMRNLRLLAMCGNFEDTHAAFKPVYDWAMRMDTSRCYANAAYILKLTKDERYSDAKQQLDALFERAKAAEAKQARKC
jgi:hypothetical protein